MKNVRSQFLSRDLGKAGEVSSSHLKKLYEMQKAWIVKPVRNLSRKHVYPNNIEKMNVKRAVEVFSSDVTSALEVLVKQAGHSCHPAFAGAGPTITFMRNIYRWFILHDTSNTMQHVQQCFPDVRHYDSPDDDRLEWLEVKFPLYMEELKRNTSSPRGFLTTETYEALLLTTYSTVHCVRFLLTRENFGFVLTRKFSSDPIESLFGTLRRSVGCNDQLDVRSAISGLEKVLKTGIAAVSQDSNVLCAEEPGPSKGVLLETPQVSKSSAELPKRAVNVLEDLRRPNVAKFATLQVSATVYVGGYIARVVKEHIECDSCSAIVTKPLTKQPLQMFTFHQDRGGLLYPSDNLLHVLETLRIFVQTALQKCPTLHKPLQTLLDAAVPAVSKSGFLHCPNTQHHHDVAKLVCSRFIKPLLVNYAFAATDKSDIYKTFFQKPVSRKYVKL
ncbi:uncharacterized protein [Dermacentor albipictus]|uniref:uncharacterized protein n=1 Tax=Dermacentor albipictus TaxID=60249 RepID=UPI0038FC4C95